MITLDSLSICRRRVLVVAAAATAAGHIRRRAAGIVVVGRRGGCAVVGLAAVFRLLLGLVVRLLRLSVRRWDEDVCYVRAVAVTLTILVVLGHRLIVYRVGEFGDYVPGVQKARDLKGVLVVGLIYRLWDVG